MQTVLITGASTGLGLALARLLRGDTWRLVLTARTESLHRFGEAGLHETDQLRIRPLDVTSAPEREALVKEIDRTLGGVDILVNNAGISYRSVVEHVTPRELIEQMDVNFQAPMELIRLVLPGMRAKRAGRIINVSSVGGMMAMPTMAVYSASKFALEGVTEALYYEVRPWNIHVSLVQPGFINSAGFRHVRYTPLSARSEQDPTEPYHEHYRTMAPFIERLMTRSSSTPETVARVILKTMTRRRLPLRVSATSDALLFYLLRRLLPRDLYHGFLYRNLPEVQSWGGAAGPPRSNLPPS